ncbi:MAG TPA: caspase family protein [Pyrinomonadaceae bacterium]
MTVADVATPANKRALLVGVNKYPNLPPYSQLRGCVNDVERMRLTLVESFGFSTENIKVLVDEQATEQGIRAAMDQIVAECLPNDIVVFHFSGHGSRMAAIGDKAAGYDESIIPYDSGRMNPDFPVQIAPRDIRDTELQEWLSKLTWKTPHVTLIFDSCHSGSITRMDTSFEEAGTRLRWIEPDPLPSGQLSQLDQGSESRGVSRASGWLPPSEKYVLLAACAAEQGAYELDHEEPGSLMRNGAFTFFLTKELNQMSDGTYQDVWDVVSTKVNNRFNKQTPLLEGARDRKVFDVVDFVPKRYLLVTSRDQELIQLAGGEIHGVVIGSQWEVYPPGTKDFVTGSGASYGVVHISSVGPVTAHGTILEEGDTPISESCRAVEVMRSDMPKLGLWLAPAPGGYEEEMARLHDLLAQSAQLELTDAAESARLIVRIVPSHAEKPDATATWEVLDHSNTKILASKTVGTPDARLTIVDNLEVLCRYERVLELRNEKSVLRGKVDFVLLKKDPYHQWQPVEENEPVFKDGASIAFRIINRSGIPLHVSVLDLGLSKRIGLLYPLASASETLASGRSGDATITVGATGVLTVGDRPEDEIELFFPENLDAAYLDPSGESPRAKEVLKLCVTTQRHDLGFLSQNGLRKKAGSELVHPMEQLLHSYINGHSTRDARPKLHHYDEWLTIERPFWLERKA